MSGPGRRDDRDRARRAQRSASRTCSRSTWAARAPTSASSSTAQQRHTTEYEIEWGLPAAVPLIDIKSIGAGGGSIAWVDAGGFLRVGPAERRRRSGPDLLRPRRHRGRRSPTRTCCSAASIPTTSSAGGCALDAVGDRPTRWRRSASRSGSRRSSSRRRSSRSRTRTWRARSRWSRSSAATIRAASRSSPSAAPGRCTRRRSRASLGIPKVIVPQHPGRLLGARPAARGHPRRQGLDAGVPLERTSTRRS